ncbi:cell division protein FtsQ/DivIB [uncultured Acidaminococcus sp.]|uniref:cell division protein FtsQ/DivIB n=1 Tax=uncultured Acidaminococcus sp. TaxID=352152 RepID=UPI002623BFEC|nr:cell division protein FtsQ/DivIB [uncultured Acidaminococcus sp.]
MMRPKWLQPRIGQGHRGNREDLRKNRQAEVRKDQPEQGGFQENPADGRQERAGDTQPRTSSFRQEMRAARLRQEEARKQAEAIALEREKIRQEAQAYIYGRTEAQETQALADRAAGRETFRARREQQEPQEPQEIPQEDMRRRAGRKRPDSGKDPEKRRPRRRLNKARAALLLCSFLLLMASYVLLHQPWLAFGQLQVVGDTAVTLEEVREMGDAGEPLNIFNINRKKLLASLRSDYRVEKAELALGWPNVLKVVITDRKPALYVTMEGKQYAQVDPTGHIIGLADGITGGEAPFVSGWHIAAAELGDVTEDEEIQGILGFLGKLDPTLRDRIMEIHVDENKSIKIYLHNGIPIILGTWENGVEKLETFKSICQELEAKKIKAQYIDLTYEKPYIKL